MPLKYKIDVLAALISAGFSTYRLQKEKLLSQSTIQKLRDGQPISWANIEKLCSLLHCQPGDILIIEE